MCEGSALKTHPTHLARHDRREKQDDYPSVKPTVIGHYVFRSKSFRRRPGTVLNGTRPDANAKVIPRWFLELQKIDSSGRIHDSLTGKTTTTENLNRDLSQEAIEYAETLCPVRGCTTIKL